jgi:hypothetical protein
MVDPIENAAGVDVGPTFGKRFDMIGGFFCLDFARSRQGNMRL